MSRHEYITASLDQDPPDYIWEHIAGFKRRAEDLDGFIRSENWGIHNVSINRTNEDLPHISGSLPDETLLERLYRRFRFFILEKEKSNYRRLLKLLSAATSSEVGQLYLRVCRKEFLTNDILDFAFITAKRPYHPEEVIDCWFNAFYFHDDPSKHETLSKFTRMVSDNGAKVALWHVVWDASLRVRRLNWLLRETTRTNPVMYIPYLCTI